MNADQLKYAIIEQLILLDDDDLLEKVAKLIRSVPKPYRKDDITPMSVNELEMRIKRSKKDASEGRVRTSEEMKDHFRKK